jgi:hypothetical protein
MACSGTAYLTLPFLSNSTVSRTQGMSCNIECELMKRIKIIHGFAMQADESTDVTGLSVSLSFVRWTEEEILMYTPLLTHTTREDIFNPAGLYMAEKYVRNNVLAFAQKAHNQRLRKHVVLHKRFKPFHQKVLQSTAYFIAISLLGKKYSKRTGNKAVKIINFIK